MMLLDSNIVIYATKPEHAFLRQLIADHAPAVSAISYVEVLGYHSLTTSERQWLEAFFQSSTILSLTSDVLDRAVALRQSKKMTLGDACVAATALVHGRKLVTRNDKEFAWIPDLEVWNPFPA
jgi:predicted nucleic acid-binding protein